MIIGDGIVLGAGGETASIFVTGLSETDTVTATNGSKTKTGVWTQKPNPAIVVPDGYTQLEYIESTGTQYIDTNWVPANGDILTVESSLSSGTSEAGFAGYNGQWELYYSNMKVGAWSGSTTVTALQIESGTVNYNQKNTVQIRFDSSQSTGTAYLFLYRTDKYTFSGRIYSATANKSNGTKIRDFIPVKRLTDNTIGMYDLVNNAFYANSGTGTFTAGPEIPQTIDGFLIDKIKSYGTWTVTATDGTNTATQDVLVDSANVFNVEIKFVDANTVLLLHADDFMDSSPNNLTVTNTNVTLSDNSKFGSKSFYFNGSNARLNITPTSKFEFGTGDFTVEMWIYPESQTNDHFFFSGSESGSFFFGIGFTVSKIGYGRTSVDWDGMYAVSIPNSSWTHIAIVRASNVVTIYVNGVSVGSATYTTAVTMGSGEVDIGSQGAGLYYKGCMDEVRVSDIARWTSNFTPPSEPY